MKYGKKAYMYIMFKITRTHLSTKSATFPTSASIFGIGERRPLNTQGGVPQAYTAGAGRTRVTAGGGPKH